MADANQPQNTPWARKSDPKNDFVPLRTFTYKIFTFCIFSPPDLAAKLVILSDTIINFQYISGSHFWNMFVVIFGAVGASFLDISR